MAGCNQGASRQLWRLCGNWSIALQLELETPVFSHRCCLQIAVEVRRSETEHPVGSLAGPHHARPAQSLGADLLDRAFHRSTANWESGRFIFGVAHAMPIRPQITKLPFNSCAVHTPTLAQTGDQGLDDRPDSALRQKH